MTNADKIRAMSDEELVNYVPCPGIENDVSCGTWSSCDECILNWLKDEVKE